jgi:hypothetical protein
MMKLVSSILTICLTILSYLSISLRALLLSIQIHLYRTLHILTEFPALIINITINRHLRLYCLHFYLNIYISLPIC